MVRRQAGHAPAGPLSNSAPTSKRAIDSRAERWEQVVLAAPEISSSNRTMYMAASFSDQGRLMG